MVAAPIPVNEAERLERLRAYGILDTPPELRFDRITSLLARLLGVPIAVISLVDEHRQWFKSVVGLDATETPRDVAFCAHAILDDAPLIVPNATDDDRFKDNPLVTGAPDIRFYAGAPLVTADGLRLGTLCAIDRDPRILSEDETTLLRELSAIVIDEIELTTMTTALANHARVLQEQNEAIHTFSRALSHDLAGPIRRIRSFCDILDSEPEEEGLDKSCLDHISKSATRAATLMSDLRNYFEIDAKAEMEQCSVRACLDAALETLAVEVGEAGATVKIGELPSLEFYPSLLTTLFQNLIENAVKYRSDRALEIDITSEDLGESWGMAVRDNGMGIAEKDKERIFEHLVRLHAESEISGTGLGLAICRKIVRRAGGDIRVATSGDSGTTIVFELPKTHAAVA